MNEFPGQGWLSPADSRAASTWLQEKLGLMTRQSWGSGVEYKVIGPYG